MSLTADTITDEQIKALRDATGWLGARCEADRRMLRSALQGNREARQCCADLLNASAMHCRGLLCYEAHARCECDCEGCLRSTEVRQRVRGWIDENFARARA